MAVCNCCISETADRAAQGRERVPTVGKTWHDKALEMTISQCVRFFRPLVTVNNVTSLPAVTIVMRSNRSAERVHRPEKQDRKYATMIYFCAKFMTAIQ